MFSVYMRVTFSIGVLLFLVACMKSEPETDGRVNQIAHEIFERINQESRSLIVETPEELRSRLFHMNLRLGINNLYGPWSGPYADEQLVAECRAVAPDYPSSETGDLCVSTILRRVVTLVRERVDPVVLARIEDQNSIFRQVTIEGFRDRFLSDIHINEVAMILNHVLERESSGIVILVDESLTARSPNWGRLTNWKPVLRGHKTDPPETVMDVLVAVVRWLEPCLRQRPGVVWLGDDCAGFELVDQQ